MEPLGMASITAVLRENGFNTWLIADYIKDDHKDKIINFNPDIIGLSLHQSTMKNVFQFCRWAKNIFSNVLIVTGGYLSTYYDYEVLQKCGDIDIVIIGEGEETFLDIANTIENKDDYSNIPGITYRNHNQIIANDKRKLIQDINSLPIPCRDILIKIIFV